jgi:fucose permease
MEGNLQRALIIMIPCYLYILFFAVYGHKIGYRAAVTREDSLPEGRPDRQP